MKLFNTQNRSQQPANTLWIAEQIPGRVESGDVTSVLNSKGYWPSYNVPYFVDIFNAMGYPEAIKKQGPAMLSYDSCVRAKLFAAGEKNVFDMPAMMFMMQYNDYQNNPVEQNNSIYAIAARGDLHPDPNRGCFGAIDAKVSSLSMYRGNRQVMAYSGPTPQQQPFNFSTIDESLLNCRSNGMNIIYDHLWQHFEPAL